VKFIKRWTIRAIAAVLLIVGTLVIGGALDARRRHPDLKPWHLMVPNDLTASEMSDTFEFSRLLARENEAFATVDAVEAAVADEDRTPVNRYAAGSRAHYSQAGQNWNRTFELQPDVISGGALLIHGLTDSPYSMRAVAETLKQQGYYALALCYSGRWTDAYAATQRAIRQSPRDPSSAIYYGVAAYAQFVGRNYQEAIALAREATRQRGDLTGAYRVLTVAAGMTGQIELARSALAELRRTQPNISLAWIATQLPWKHDADREHYLEGFRRAGLE